MKNGSVKRIAFILAIIMIINILPMYMFGEETANTETEGSVTNYTDFMSDLKTLETYADEYAAQIYGRDPGELVLNFIRTGVERYQDDNWTTLAGQEIVGFTQYVKAQDAEKGTTAMNLKNIVVGDAFTLPNKNKVDFGHMFGCMNISYINKGSADLSGWAGDICDLLQYSVSQLDVINANTDGSVEGMAKYIRENCFGVNASGAYGWDDFWGDMDAYYLVSEYNKYNGTKKFSEIMEAYFTSDLNDTDRTVYFMNHRFAVADSQEAVRKAIYESYTADVGLKILESKRGLTSYNALREACCYAFADYVYSQAKGKLIEGEVEETGPANGYYSVFSKEHSILAPGITQDINYAQTADGKQIVYYVATVDVTREDVTIVANYKDNDPSKGWGLQSVRDQVYALMENNKDKEHYYPIVATNGDGYNITNGTPGGLLIMNGEEYYPVDKDGFFAILKNGRAVIGTQAEYEQYRGQIQDAIGGFGAVLVKDGKINVTKNANYTANRASRTAIGIKADGSVVMMVLDGRQLPRSAGGAMEEIAQIMLEAGCVHAINLDGGGSTTYLSKPAGSDEIQLTNVPSDGYERQVSVSLVAISTAAPSTAFDHAVISSDYEYITAGTSMQFSVTGVSNTGNAAPIPAGSYWKVSDTSLATIDGNGVFTAKNYGDVTVEYIVNGEVAGGKVIHIVIPDDIKFAEDRITAIYGEAKEIGVTVWYQGYPVAFTPLVDAIVLFEDTEDLVSPAGVIDGMTFIGDETSGIRTTRVLAVVATSDSEIVKLATINLYYKDEATFDFENATQGNRKLAWNREIENAKSTDNMLYRISDPNKPVQIDYTFALDITAIDFPPQLEPIKSMLPTYQDGASAWNYLLQLAERVCVQTNVTIKAEFSPDLEVNIDNLKVINDYFELTSANLDENNVLTIVCNWKNQSQPIDPATANPLCILSGITATVKDTAAYFNNEVLIANNGNVYYDIYLAASSLYSFASNPENQAKYGLYPYIHEEDCRSDFVTEEPDIDVEGGAATVADDATNNDKGARFSSQYMDFADIYVINNEIRQGWHEENGGYYYYVNNEVLTGTQLVPDRKNATQDRFYEFDETGKLISEDGKTGLVEFNGNLYYAVQGVAQTGWQQIDNKDYYFHPDTGKAANGIYKIREKLNPAVADGKTPMVWYTYTFTDYVLTRGDLVYDQDIYGDDGKKHTGYHYRWAGSWMKGWFEVDGNTYWTTKNYPCMLATGYQYIMRQDAVSSNQNQFHLFDENGVFQKDYTGVYFDGTNYVYLKNGVRHITAGLYEDNGYYYYVNANNGLLYVNQTNFEVKENRANGLVPEGKYNFDEYGRLENDLLTDKITITDKTAKEGETSKITTEILGRVMTITHDVACKVIYKNSADEYVLLDAMVNPYATKTLADGTASEYNFAIPAEATEVQIILAGDANCDGNVDETDVNYLKSGLLGTSKVDAIAALLADVNGDGEFSIADVARLNAASHGKINLDW